MEKNYKIFVTEKIVKDAKKLGFELEECGHGSFDSKADAMESFVEGENFIIKHASNDYVIYNLPTVEEICGWLRDNGVYVWVEIFTERNMLGKTPSVEKGKGFEMYTRITITSSKFKKVTLKNTTICFGPSSTYEKALIYGIEKAFWIIK